MEKKKMIFYSLGNFIFDTDFQRSFDGSDIGILLSLSLKKDTFGFDSMPIYINRKTRKIELAMNYGAFREINKQEYRELWPVQTKKIEQVSDRRRQLSGQVGNHNSRSLFNFLRIFKRILFNKKMRYIYLGKIIYRIKHNAGIL